MPPGEVGDFQRGKSLGVVTCRRIAAQEGRPAQAPMWSPSRSNITGLFYILTWAVGMYMRNCCDVEKNNSKPSLIRLHLFRMWNNPGWNMKNSVHSWVRTLNKTRCIQEDNWVTCLFRQNLRQSLQTCIITFRNKYSFWALYRWINVLSFYSF